MPGATSRLTSGEWSHADSVSFPGWPGTGEGFRAGVPPSGWSRSGGRVTRSPSPGRDCGSRREEVSAVTGERAEIGPGATGRQGRPGAARGGRDRQDRDHPAGVGRWDLPRPARARPPLPPPRPLRPAASRPAGRQPRASGARAEGPVHWKPGAGLALKARLRTTLGQGDSRAQPWKGHRDTPSQGNTSSPLDSVPPSAPQVRQSRRGPASRRALSQQREGSLP